MVSEKKFDEAQSYLDALTKDVKFISNGTWFDLHTKATMIGSPFPTWDKDGNLVGSALFEGIRHGKPDEEVCSLSEFDLWRGNTRIQESCKRFMDSSPNSYLKLRYL